MARINQQPTPVNQQPTVDPGRAVQQHQVVQVRGQEIQTVPNQLSLAAQAVEDSAEEVTMMFQDKSADRLKKREAKSKSYAENASLKYLIKVRGVQSAERFEKLHENLKQLKNPTREQVKQLIAGFSEGGDHEGIDADVLMALEEALALDGADELLDIVSDLQSELGHELKDFFKDTVKTTSDMGQVYGDLLGEFGEADFEAATDRLMTKLGEDLQGETSNVDPAKIKATVDALYNLQVARNTFGQFAKLLQRMEDAFEDAEHSWQKEEEESRNKREQDQNPEEDE